MPHQLVIELSDEEAEQLARIAQQYQYGEPSVYVQALIQATIDTLKEEAAAGSAAPPLDEDDIEAFRQSWLKRRETMTDEEFWQSIEEDIVTVYARASQSQISPETVRRIIAVIEQLDS